MYFIDLDANPFIPPRFELVEHKRGGRLEWDATKVALYLSRRQLLKGGASGHELCKELEGKPALNANVLDFLLAHHECIPQECKRDSFGPHVLFRGTTYRWPSGELCVRALIYDHGTHEWYWGAIGLDQYLNDDNPSLILAT